MKLPLEKHSGPNKLNNIEAVKRWIHRQDISLNSEQEELLQRLHYCDEKIRSRKFSRDEIVTAIRTRFSVSQWRAELDITEAHNVFGVSRKLNKNYLISEHIENIGRHIKLAEELKRIDLLQKLNDSYTYALNSLPADSEINKSSPAKIIFVIKGSDKHRKTVDELIAEADNLIKATVADDGEYIEYDDQ
jgi:hypothetical protein